MLSLTIAPGEYLTIGENVVVQMECVAGDRCKIAIHAPREIPIVRGEVLERMGGKRPACVFSDVRRYRREVPWNRSKAQALNAMRKVLSGMDGEDDDVKALRRQLNHIFPPADKTPEKPSLSMEPLE